MELAINMMISLIILVTTLATVFVISYFTKPQQELESLLHPDAPWPFESRDKGIFLAMKFIDYENGECFCEVRKISSPPTRMATRADYQQIMTTQVNKYCESRKRAS